MIDDKQLLQFFGKRLRMARHAAHLSQEDLAKRTGTGQDTISHYESGQCRPDLTTLARLAEELGVNAGYFFPDNTYSSLDDKQRDTLALLGSLPPLTLQYLLTFVQHVADGQRHRQFLTGDVSRLQEGEFALRLFVERDLRKLEQDILQRPLSSGTSPLQLLARFTGLMLLMMHLDNEDSSTDELIQRLAVSGQRLTLLVRRIKMVRETAAGA